MDAARGHGLQSVLHVSEDRGIAEPLRNSTDAHWAAEEDNAPKANGKLEGEDAAALGRESDAETGADRGLVGADCPDPRVGSSPLGLRFRKVPKPGMHPEGFSPYVMRPRQVPVPNYYRTSTELLPNCYQLLPPPSPPPSSSASSSFFARRCARAQSYDRRLPCADVQFKECKAHSASIAPGDPARPCCASLPLWRILLAVQPRHVHRPRLSIKPPLAAPLACGLAPRGRAAVVNGLFWHYVLIGHVQPRPLSYLVRRGEFCIDRGRKQGLGEQQPQQTTRCVGGSRMGRLFGHWPRGQGHQNPEAVSGPSVGPGLMQTSSDCVEGGPV